MAERYEIKGGAGEFEAAVIAVVLDRIVREENAFRQGAGKVKAGLPAWMRALGPERPGSPRERVWPD